MELSHWLTIAGITLPILLGQWASWKATNKSSTNKLIEEAVKNSERDNEIKSAHTKIDTHMENCEKFNTKIENYMVDSTGQFQAIRNEIQRLVNK